MGTTERYLEGTTGRGGMLAVDAYDQRMTEDNSFVMETGTPIECFSFKRI